MVTESNNDTNQQQLNFAVNLDQFSNKGKYVSHSDSDAFYFFIHYLGKEIRIPVRNKWEENEDIYFSLSDGASKEGEELWIKDLIKKEKMKWDKFGYTSPEDLKKENKRLVDAKISKDEKLIKGSKLSIATEWEKLDPLFTPELQAEWEAEGFNYEEAKKWVGDGFSHKEAWFARSFKDNFGFVAGESKIFKISKEMGIKMEDTLIYSSMKKKHYTNKDHEIFRRELLSPPENIINENLFKDGEIIKMEPNLPLDLLDAFKEENTLKDNYNISSLDKAFYTDIYPLIFPWKISKDKTLTKLPIKLYNIKTNQVEETKELTNIKNYGIISYVWGNPNIKATEGMKKRDWWKKELTISGNKTLYKAIETCKKLGIDYLWMDQLCIDQNNVEEKNQEVPKMRQYYSDAVVTLIAIQRSVDEKTISKWHDTFKKVQLPSKGKKSLLALSSVKKGNVGIDMGNIGKHSLPLLYQIINSEWFQRSWTYQEGWLSKQTIFMFDNILIDGRFMALIWKIGRNSFWVPFFEWISDFEEINKTYANEKTATPLGWVYYKDGYSPKNKVIISLGEALRAIKGKKRSVSLDGIYSILGLLPYGEKVVPKYREWGHNYTKEELEKALLDVMKTAVQNGYGEPLAWHGIGSDTPGKSWIPKIDENGSTKVEKGLEVSCEPKSVTFMANFAIKITGSEHIIVSVDHADKIKIMTSSTSTTTSSGNLYRICCWIKTGDDYKMIMLQGSSLFSIKSIKSGDKLVVPNKKEWACFNGFESISFAILASTREGSNVYQRIDLVELVAIDGRLKLEEDDERELIIGSESQEERTETLKHLIKNLTDGYEQLLRARRNYDQKIIAKLQDDIKTIRQDFLDLGVNSDHLQKICDSCDKTAKNRLKLELQAQIQIPPK